MWPFNKHQKDHPPQDAAALHGDKIVTARILAKLDAARLFDSRHEVFGAGTHQYILHPPATADAIERFEAQHAIALPQGYRLFLRHIGNGGVGYQGSGAGLFYGIYPLGHAEQGDSARALANPYPLAPNMSKAEWEPLAARLEAADGDYEVAFGDVYGGLLALGSQGCSLMQYLVLNGPFAGRVVNVDAESHEPPRFAFEPDFLAWYERWLDEVLGGELSQKNPVWFGYVKGGKEEQLLAEFKSSIEAQARDECLSGLQFKRKLRRETLLDLASLYFEHPLHRPAIAKVVAKSDYSIAQPLLADLAMRDPLAFLQCLHWHARDHIREWQTSILACADNIDNAELFRFFCYVAKELPVDQGIYLAPYTQSTQQEIRRQAFHSLGEIEDRQSYLPQCICGLNDANPDVVRVALQALRDLNSPSLLPHYKNLVARFPVETHYVLSNLERRLHEFGTSIEQVRKHS